MSKFKVPNLPESGFVYGSGSFATGLVTTLDNLGIEVLGVIDHVQIGALVEGFEVLFADDASIQGEAVFVGIHNFRANLPSIVTHALKLGAARVLTPPQIANALGEVGVLFENYWMTNRTGFEIVDQKELSFVLDKLSDQKSKELLVKICSYRVSGEIEEYPYPDSLDLQYFPEDVPFFKHDESPVNYVDLGAFNGDTLGQFKFKGIAPSQYFAFEPDAANFHELTICARDQAFAVQCLPLAVSDTNEIIRFDSNQDGSAEVIVGGTPVQTVSLSDFLNNIPVSHIKFDIEGGESLSIMFQILP
jgi:FkbM family methyltransferase